MRSGPARDGGRVAVFERRGQVPLGLEVAGQRQTERRGDVGWAQTAWSRATHNHPNVVAQRRDLSRHPRGGRGRSDLGRHHEKHDVSVGEQRSARRRRDVAADPPPRRRTPLGPPPDADIAAGRTSSGSPRSHDSTARSPRQGRPEATLARQPPAAVAISGQRSPAACSPANTRSAPPPNGSASISIARTARGDGITASAAAKVLAPAPPRPPTRQP